MRIGEVHAILRRDVPDIELSKIRYYEDKGLVQPTRSRKGYRLYSQRDVECLREAIRLANEEFVPLRVVRLRLIEQGLLVDGPVVAGTRQVARAASSVISVPVPVPVAEHVDDAINDGLIDLKLHAHPVTSPVDVGPAGAPEQVATDEVATTTSALEDGTSLPVAVGPEALGAPVATRASIISEEFDDRDDRFYSPSEFLVTSGLDASTMNQLVASGLLSPETVANQSALNDLDLRVARAIKVLLARNVDIRLFGSLRRNVEREIGLVDDLIQPTHPSKKPVSARETCDNARVVALEIEALRGELFTRALHKYLGH
jgi:hypothetical protein